MDFLLHGKQLLMHFANLLCLLLILLLQLLLHSMRELLQSGHIAWRRRRRHGGKKVDRLKGRQDKNELID